MFLDFWEEDFARAASSTIAYFHDSRYDDREAIVFLWPNVFGGYLPELEANQYYFGHSFMLGHGGATYSVSSEFMKLWLLEATTSGISPASSNTEKQFMLDAPGSSGASGSGPTIGLSALKTRIADIEAEANAGGTPEYRSCVLAEYSHYRRLAYQLSENGGEPLWRRDRSMESGLPAGSVILERPYRAIAPNVRIPKRYWFEGRPKTW